MNRLSLALIILFTLSIHADHPGAKDVKPVTLIAGLGNHHHAVSTKNAEAQKFFDQGLTLLFAFNHDEAARSFKRAATLDPDLAMAHWGIAVVRGPNYNLDADDQQWKDAYAALQKALELAKSASEPERAYIHALAKRYGPDPKADRKNPAIAYKEAMGELSRKYPDDLDAATLYAESAMNLRPWQLWSPDGKPAEGTEEIVHVLESVLNRNPDHPGANHYYIHAIEASSTPERGLACAQRLQTLCPGAGHLVHMPSHIYMRVGDFAAAAKSNEKAIAADIEYFKKHDVTGVYPMMYFPHNIHFVSIAHCFQGRHADAKNAAAALADHVRPNLDDMPMLEGFMVVPSFVQVRFQRWDDILATPKPAAKWKMTMAVCHFARACAFHAKGEADKAKFERAAFRAVTKELPEDAKVSDWNSAQKVFAIADKVLDARFILSAGDTKKAIEQLKEAVTLEDALAYGEPPDWILPAREPLGAALLRDGAASEAEKVFRAGLVQYRRSGRILFGLRESLKAQGRLYEASLIDQEFRRAWQNADEKELSLKGF